MAASEPPYRFESAPGYTVVVIQPQLNDSQWADFEVVGNELLNRIGDVKPPALLVDLSSLSYMGSAMVALIVRLWKAIRERGGKMVVINRHEMVYEVMKLAGLTNVWTIVPDREHALRALGRKGGGTGGPDTGSVLLAVGAIGVLVAAIGIAMMFHVFSLGLAPKTTTAITVAGAVLGLIGGAVTASRASGNSKTAGILIVAASAVLLIIGIVMMPSGRVQATEGPVSSSSTESAATPATDNKPRVSDDGDSKRQKRRENRDETNIAPTDPNTAAAIAPKADNQPPISVLNVGEGRPADTATKSPVDTKGNAQGKSPVSFGSAKQPTEKKEGEKK